MRVVVLPVMALLLLLLLQAAGTARGGDADVCQPQRFSLTAREEATGLSSTYVIDYSKKFLEVDSGYVWGVTLINFDKYIQYAYHDHIDGTDCVVQPVPADFVPPRCPAQAGYIFGGTEDFVIDNTTTITALKFTKPGGSGDVLALSPAAPHFPVYVHEYGVALTYSNHSDVLPDDAFTLPKTCQQQQLAPVVG